MMLSPIIPPHSLLDSLVCCKVDGMRRAYATILIPAAGWERSSHTGAHYDARDPTP